MSNATASESWASWFATCRASASDNLDRHAAAVGRAAAALDPAAALEPVEDAGHRCGMQPGAPGQGARTDRAMPADEVKTLQVCGLEVKPRANAVAELRELRAKVAQGVLDLPVQPAAVRWHRPPGRWFRFHML